jgi:hypothetical protein
VSGIRQRPSGVELAAERERRQPLDAKMEADAAAAGWWPFA